MLTRTHVLLLALLTVTASLPAVASPQGPQGHWEELGRDGRIFVPAEPPATTELPGEDLGAYHNATETGAALAALEAARPDLFDHAILGTSVQGRPLHKVTVTAPGDPAGRARVLIDGAHHGDEVIASEILVRFLERIEASYGSNTTIQQILSRTVLDVVPMVNPDGVSAVPQCSYYADCRKNANGVDLNRNYAAHWGGTGSSGDPGSATYRGPSPLSEPESTALATLMTTHDYAAYASLHSGAEMILWPYGHTTDRPPEVSLYQALGQELTDATGAPHGQVSRILYSVSGDSMDHAYDQPGIWHPISISPETYEGAGNAFDWWDLFNPPEHRIDEVTDRWSAFLWHLADQAPGLAPVELVAPEAATIGPEPGRLALTVEAPSRRGLMGAQLEAETHGLPITLDPAPPVPLADGTGTRNLTFTVDGHQAAQGPLTLRLAAEPMGQRAATVDLTIVQVGLDLLAQPATITTPETSQLTASVDAGPFDRVTGNLTLSLQGNATPLATGSFEVTPGAPATLTSSMTGQGLAQGDHALQAVATFTVWEDGQASPGQAVATATLHVTRPELSSIKLVHGPGTLAEPVRVTLFHENTGDHPARQVEVREALPPGLVPWFRDGPVPIPPDPLGRPVPDAIEPRQDGGLTLVYTIGQLAPGETSYIQYQAMPLVLAEHALTTQWSYEGHFEAGMATYADQLTRTYTVQGPVTP